MAPSHVRRAGPGAAALGLVILVIPVSGCTSGGETRDEPALVAASDAKPPRRRCEISTHSLDVGTTRTIRCIEDLDRDGVPDAIEVTRRQDSSNVVCVRSEREGDRWRQVAPCIPEP